jgi:hypothetical protein
MEDELLNLLNKMHNVVLTVYEKQGLNSLRGINGELTINGKQILEWYLNATAKGEENYQVNFYQLFQDILSISDEIM